MSFVMVDVESDGPIPGDYSMISFAAMIVSPGMDISFKGLLKPISDKYLPEALAISGHSREETLTFANPALVMNNFQTWLKENVKGRPMFISDNNGYDWMFICWYFHHFLGDNPFGYSSTNLGSLYKGMVKDFYKNFKHLRKTEHTHDPLDDVRGNVEALLAMKEMGLVIAFK
jgi:hypothetical protein